MKFFAKLDNYAIRHNKIFSILLTPYIAFISLAALLYSYEYFNVGILKQTEGYPWGCKCVEGVEHYASPELYSHTMLVDAMFSWAAIMILLLFVMKKRSFYPFTLVLLYTAFLIIFWGLKLI